MSIGVVQPCESELVQVSYGDKTFQMCVPTGIDDPVVDEIREGRPYQWLLLELLQTFFPQPAVVMDLGAHIGSFCVPAAVLGHRVVAVEGGARNVELVQKSRDVNGLENLTVLHAAVSDASGESVHFHSHGPWGYVLPASDASSFDSVATKSVADISAELKLPRVDFIKIDIEGSELAAFKGMRSLFNSASPPVIVFESNGHALQRYGASAGDLLSLLESEGYQVFFMGYHEFTRMRPESIALLGCVDCIAVKGRPLAVNGWKVRPPYSEAELVAKVLEMGTADHESHRGWAAAALRTGPRHLLTHSKVKRLLDRLSSDPSDYVRTHVSWWSPELQYTSGNHAAGTQVLHLSSWRKKCGIADYVSHLTGELNNQNVASAVFPVRVAELRWTPLQEIAKLYDSFCDLARDFDVIHIQHEFSFFRGPGQYFDSCRMFSRVLKRLKELGKPVVVTFHTEPDLDPHNTSRRAAVKALLRRICWRRYVAPYFSTGSNMRAIVHTAKSRFSLVRGHFAPENVRVVTMGHPLHRERSLDLTPEVAKTKIGLPPDAVVLTIFGFIADYKGHAWAAEALKRLPDNYYLVMVGGTHPDSEGDLTMDSVLQSWSRRKKKRVIITGYVPKEMVDVYHAATDICLAPYIPCNLSSSAAITWALSSGKPTIATKIPAFKEINEQSNCMVLVNFHAVHELAWQVKALAENKPLQEQLVRNAVAYCDKHSWPATAAATQSIYAELLKSPV